MGDGDRDDRLALKRRGFFGRLRGHESVVAVDFTRDRFRTVFAEVDPEGGLDGELWRTAERLGYTVQCPGTDEHRQWRLAEWWEGSHEAVYVFRLESDRAPFAP